MTPNGYDPEGEEKQIESRPFRDVMEEALEATRYGVESDRDTSAFLVLIQNASDVPEKARPFVDQVKKLVKSIDVFVKNCPEDESQINKEEVSAMLREIASSCEKLVEVSETNSALKSFSENVQREVQIFIATTEEMLDVSQEMDSHKASLDDLFD